MLKADFHIHTNKDPYDKYIKYSPKELILHCKKLNYNVLSITHHCSVFNNKEDIAFARKNGILLISGTESLIEGKEVLIINPPNEFESMGFNKIKSLSELKNSAIIAPHPFFPRNNCLKNKLIQNINVFHGIEYSHFYTRYLNYNKKAKQIALKYDKSLIGTSDAHFLYQIGKNYTLINCKNNVKSVIEAIKNNKVKLVTKPLSTYEFFKIGTNHVLTKPKTIKKRTSM